MPQGRHVTLEECREMRRLREETLMTLVQIGERVGDDEPYYKGTVRYHVKGRCTHIHDQGESDDR